MPRRKRGWADFDFDFTPRRPTRREQRREARLERERKVRDQRWREAEAQRQREIRERQRHEAVMVSHDYMRLKPTDFERFVAGLFERDGYEVSHRGGAGDQGCDLKMQKDGAVYVVQVKRYGSHRPIGPNHIREFETVIRRHKARHGWFVTTSDFTAGAHRAVPGGDKMSLVNRATLDAMVLRVMGARPIAPAPSPIAAGVKESLVGETPISTPPSLSLGRYTFTPFQRAVLIVLGSLALGVVACLACTIADAVLFGPGG
jgi:restriction endonuclease Mrr